MIELKHCLILLKNFSLITVGKNKRPNFSWKKQQQEKLDEKEFTRRYNYSGGYIKKDGTEMEATNNIGIVTGFEDLEVIDVDLKVLPNPTEMNIFWTEYVQTLKENIYDFENKIVIYKTVSGGYHILYKCKKIQGNSVIAKLKGHDTAIIETRGKGGYVFVYPENKISKLGYLDVQYITEQERETIWRISEAYDYKEPEQTQEIKHNKGKTPAMAFEESHSVVDLVVPQYFSIPHNGRKKNHILIKRHGAESAHSGYIFNSGCMYLFSTGTIFPAEKALFPFDVYAWIHHNGDKKAATKELYNMGYGDRMEFRKINEIQPEKIKVENYQFPIEIFPSMFQSYIKECSAKLQLNVDYMGCSLLWVASVIVGNSYEIEVKRGWTEKAIIWLALVGDAGVGKSPSIDKIVYPLARLNNREIKRYVKEYKEYSEFAKLTKKEQKEGFGENYRIEEPKKTQFIVNDITNEALIEIQQESDNSVGVYNDELAGWIKDMNKYRPGSDLEFWLSSWSSKPVYLNRKTSKSSYVDKPFIPVLGGIQPSIFNSLSTEETKDNGFLDRLLISYPEISVNYYVDNEIDLNLVKWYSEAIVFLFDEIRKKIQRSDGEIISTTVKMGNDAKKEWIRIFNKITDLQNNDSENQYMKSMYPKQKGYIPRFMLIIHVLHKALDGFTNMGLVDKETVLKAEKLSDYFVNCAKKVKIDSTETFEIKQTFKEGKTVNEKIEALYRSNPDFNRTKAAELLGVSRQHVVRVVRQVRDDEKK